MNSYSIFDFGTHEAAEEPTTVGSIVRVQAIVLNRQGHKRDEYWHALTLVKTPEGNVWTDAYEPVDQAVQPGPLAEVVKFLNSDRVEVISVAPEWDAKGAEGVGNIYDDVNERGGMVATVTHGSSDNRREFTVYWMPEFFVGPMDSDSETLIEFGELTHDPEYLPIAIPGWVYVSETFWGMLENPSWVVNVPPHAR